MEGNKPCLRLRLPREIRDIIIEKVIFEEMLRIQGSKTRADTVPGVDPDSGLAILPCYRGHPRNPKLDVCVLRTCNQLREESEVILYGILPFNLDSGRAHDTELHDFFEKFPKKHRRLIRGVEQKCSNVIIYHCFRGDSQVSDQLETHNDVFLRASVQISNISSCGFRIQIRVMRWSRVITKMRN